MNPEITSNKELLQKLPKETKILFDVFGKDIRLVGGAIRDLLLNREIYDCDFATTFLPDQLIKIANKNNLKAIKTGVKYGTVTIVINGINFEVTTLRKDVETFGRDAKVEFVDDYYLDAKRRDFTVNAFYLDYDGNLYDYFNGTSDLKNKKIKFIGDASERIKEDYLRILRFFRFSSIYGNGNFDENAIFAINKLKNNVANLSADRIRNEIFKTIEKKDNRALILFLNSLESYKIREEIFSTKFNFENLEKLFELESLINQEISDYFKFFIAINNSVVNLNQIYQKLNFSNANKKYYNFLSKNSQNQLNLQEILPETDKNLAKDLYFCHLIRTSDFNEEKISKTLEFIDNFFIPKFPINGNNIKELGFSGQEVGEMLKKAKNYWVRNNFEPLKQDILDYLKS